MIIFQNPGLLDPRSITTFGTSSKDNPSSAIGYFGTGLKYAIAILLRHEHTLQINSGPHSWSFSTEREALRNDHFHFIYMQDLKNPASPPQRLAFTTDLGKDWDLWMAFRELESNARDEGGHSFRYNGEDLDSSTDTHIIVQGGLFNSIFNRKSEYFLDTPPLEVTPLGSIHAGNGGVFYKGVRIFTSPIISRFHYNLNDIKLTENRTPAYESSMKARICNLINCLQNKSLLQEMFLVGDSFEQGLDWGYWDVDSPSLLMKEFLEPLAKTNSSALSDSLRAWFHRHQPKEAWKPVLPKPSDLQLQSINNAVDVLRRYGIEVTAPIHVCANLGDGVVGRAHSDTIYLAPRAFTHGFRFVVSTILEEHIHLETGLRDETYDMQTYLFDLVLQIGEHFTGELI